MRHLLALSVLILTTIAPAVPPRTSVTVTRFPSGAIATRTSFRDGQLDGVAEQWNENGQLLSQQQYMRGVKIGAHLTWWPNGHLRTSATYMNDAFHGEFRSWYESGHPYELRHFDRGLEAGLEQSWTEDGELYLNYEARGGRHYGLVNARPCLPADRSGASRRE